MPPMKSLSPADQAVLDREYAHVRTDRTIALQFARMQRGSVRFVEGLFRTEDEQDKFIEDGLKLRLPGVK